MRKFILFSLLSFLFFGLVPSASATTYHNYRHWHYVEMVNYFVHQGDSINLTEITTYPTYTRTRRDMRMYKAQASTAAEVKTLRSFARRPAAHKNVRAFCDTTKNHGYLLDLAYYYDIGVKKLNPEEKKHWRSYVGRYAKVRHCTLYYK